MSGDRRCPHCGVPLGDRDRVCFYCHRVVELPRPADNQASAASMVAPPPRAPERVVSLMGLTEQRGQLVKTLSGGARRHIDDGPRQLYGMMPPVGLEVSR